MQPRGDWRNEIPLNGGLPRPPKQLFTLGNLQSGPASSHPRAVINRIAGKCPKSLQLPVSAAAAALSPASGAEVVSPAGAIQRLGLGVVPRKRLDRHLQLSKWRPARPRPRSVEIA